MHLQSERKQKLSVSIFEVKMCKMQIDLVRYLVEVMVVRERKITSTMIEYSLLKQMILVQIERISIRTNQSNTIPIPPTIHLIQ